MKCLVFLLWWIVPLAAMSCGNEKPIQIIIEPGAQSASSDMSIEHASTCRPYIHITQLRRPIDYKRERNLLHVSLRGDYKEIRKEYVSLLRDQEVSENFFEDVEKALDASNYCRPTVGCLAGATVLGSSSACFGQSLVGAECPCAEVLIPCGGGILGFVSVALCFLLNSEQEELKSDLRELGARRQESIRREQQSTSLPQTLQRHEIPQPLLSVSMGQQSPEQCAMQHAIPSDTQ